MVQKTVNITFTENGQPICPECLEKENITVPMGKAGSAVSGRKKCQRYMCSRCYYKWVNTKEPYIKKD